MYPPLDWAAVLESAYQQLRRSKQSPLNEAALFSVAERAYLPWRNRCIEARAQEIAQRVSAARLLGLAESVYALVYDQGWAWESPADEEEEVWFVAYGLAALQWWHREQQGRVPPCLTLVQVTTWLNARQPPQLTQGRLF